MKREYWRYLPAVFPYLGRHKGLVTLSILLTIGGALSALADPWPLAFLVDTGLGGHPAPAIVTNIVGSDRTNLILVSVVGGFFVTLVIQGFGVLIEYVNTRIDLSVSLDVRSDLFAHCQRLSQSYHDSLTTGDFMYRINFEATQYGAMSVALLPLGQSLLTLIGMFLVALRIDTTLALVSLTVVPFIYYCIGFYGKRIEPRMILVRNLETVSLTMVNTAMAMLRVIIAFNRESFEHRRFRAQGETAVSARVRLTVYQTLFSLAVALTTAGGVGAVLYLGSRHVVEGTLTVGELLVLLSYIHAMYQPLQTISATMASFQQRLISIKFARRLFEMQPEVQEAVDAVDLGGARGRVTFDRVHFDYPSRTGTLRDISFDVKPGEVVAVVGVTGAGKSTLVSLIPRFIDPSEGRVLIDGVDIRTATLDSVREQIGFVQQEPLLFPESVVENIRYGKLEASFEEVVEAARLANAHDFIAKLPSGYETVLGERGARISGGERQRLTIARAFLKNAPILVLDEPTSSIDSRTESGILDALDRLMEGRTTFIVAHRLSTLRRADRVLVLDKGCLVEAGTQDELLERGGIYAQLHALQSGGPVVPRPAQAEPEAPSVAPPATGAATPDVGVEIVGRRPTKTAATAPATPALPRGKVVVLGMMSKMPVAGVVWQTMHYLLGFERLGLSAYYVEAHARTPSMLMRTDADDATELAAQFIGDVMHRFGFDDRWCFQALHADGACHGMTDTALRALYRDAALIVNLHGGTQPRPEHAETGRLVYLETDPVQLQVELGQGRRETLDFLEPHVAFFTFGENWGRAGCALPVDERFLFRPTRQPVVVDLWTPAGTDVSAAPFTTIGNWRQEWRDLTFDGEVYHWSKHREFEKVIDLPRRTGEPFELALAGCSEPERNRLEESGWRVRPAEQVSSDIDVYRRYIQYSRAEFTVAKDQNVRLRSGWFSDRSATYLAAGRPVITQDTGFGSTLPTGRGLFAFSTVEEAAEAVGTITGDWPRHARAAGDIAREFFRHDVVLRPLLDACGIGPTAGHPNGGVPRDGAFPLDLVVEPVSRHPLTLPEKTVEWVIGRPVRSLPTPLSAPLGTPRVTIVVVTFGNLVFTRLCLETLLANTDAPSFEVVVVDNASTDGTGAYLNELSTREPRLRTVVNEVNLGFGPAANLGFETARGDLLVLLNNDVILPPDWLSRLTRHLDDWTVGMVGPLTNRAPGETRVAVRHRTYGDVLDYARAMRHDGAQRETEVLPMQCVALRRGVFTEIGPLDTRFEVGMFEDDDYCARLRAAGYRLVCAEDAFVHHFGGATFGNLVPSGAFSRLFDENRRRYEEKWGVPWEQPATRDDETYSSMRRGLRRLVERDVPPDAILAVISRGDDDLLEFAGRHAVHFPCQSDGTYAGWYPADGDDAIAHLAVLRITGCTYIVVPHSSAWWLDYYPAFAGHLLREWGLMVREPEVGSVYGPIGGERPVPSGVAAASAVRKGDT